MTWSWHHPGSFCAPRVGLRLGSILALGLPAFPLRSTFASLTVRTQLARTGCVGCATIQASRPQLSLPHPLSHHPIGQRHPQSPARSVWLLVAGSGAGVGLVLNCTSFSPLLCQVGFYAMMPRQIGSCGGRSSTRFLSGCFLPVPTVAATLRQTALWTEKKMSSS